MIALSDLCTAADSRLRHIGPTGRVSLLYFVACIGVKKYNKDTSAYAQHMLNTGHSYGNTQNTIEITQITTKSQAYEQP
jgi:hypothetical protein